MTDFGSIEKDKRPVISVVLPVFNAALFVEQAVISILEQTFDDFELIIINDGSTDESYHILQRLQKADSRIVLCSRENRGLVETLNEGISLARGAWIARMDADDIALPDRFNRQLQQLEKYGADVCGSWIKLFGNGDSHTVQYAETDDGIRMALLFGSPFAHPTIMMRTSLAQKMRYDKAWECCEDYDLWERIARAGFKMTNVPAVLLRYRQHATQISSRASIVQQTLTQKVRRRYWRYMCMSWNIDEKWINDILKLRDPSSPVPNMDHVDAAIKALLAASKGEARSVVIDQARRLYFRAAYSCSDIASRWANFNISEGGIFSTAAKLWMVSRISAHPDSKIFMRLKRIYWKFGNLL